MRLLICTGLLLTTPLALRAQSTAPRFISLGQLAPPPVGWGTGVLDVSSDGMVAVGFAYDGAHNVAARWTNVGGWQSLGFANPSSSSNTSNAGQATNADGSIVAGNISSSLAQGFVWKASTGIVVMPRLPGGQQLYVRDLSRDGRFVVGMSDTPGGWRGYRLDLLSQLMIDLTQTPIALSNVTSGDARGVSDNGGTVAGSFVGVNGYTFTWTPTNGTSPVNKGGAAAVGVAVVSGDGTVLGGSSSPTLQSNGPPTRWVNNVPQSLPVPPGGDGRGIVSVTSDDGLTMAGTYRFVTGPFTDISRSFVWREDFGSVDLVSYITVTLGLGLQDFSSMGIASMSRDGSVWVGSGIRDGRVEGWMLRLPGALPLCAVDLGTQGGAIGPDGHLDNNDFIVFIADFFTLNARADVGRQGGVAGGDGLFDNNDFIVFIAQFFEGCN